MLTKSKSLLIGLVVVALTTGCGVVKAACVGDMCFLNSPASTTTTTPHSMLNPEAQSKYIVSTKGKHSKKSYSTANESGSSQVSIKANGRL